MIDELPPLADLSLVRAAAAAYYGHSGRHELDNIEEQMLARMEAVFALPSINAALVEELSAFPKMIREVRHSAIADNFDIDLAQNVIRAIAEGRCNDPKVAAAAIAHFDTLSYDSIH